VCAFRCHNYRALETHRQHEALALAPQQQEQDTVPIQYLLINLTPERCKRGFYPRTLSYRHYQPCLRGPPLTLGSANQGSRDISRYRSCSRSPELESAALAETPRP
jgi:hypothetical protein